MLSSAPIEIQESTCVASTNPVGSIGFCAASLLPPAMRKPTTSAPAATPAQPQGIFGVGGLEFNGLLQGLGSLFELPFHIVVAPQQRVDRGVFGWNRQ